MAEVQTGSDRPTRRTRSPNYPAINLDQAIERARTLWNHETKHAASLDVIAQHWGYKDFGVSGAMQTLAALKAFGLVEIEGKGGGRMAKLSERAMDILHLLPDDKRWRQAIVDAALAPAIYNILWVKYGGALPSDANLRSLLIRDYGFNPGAVESFIEKFRDTIALADRATEGTLSESSPRMESMGSAADEADTADFAIGNQGMIASANPQSGPAFGKPVLTDLLQERWNLPSGPVILNAPASMTAEDLEIFNVYLQAWMMRAKADVKRRSDAWAAQKTPNREER